MSKKKVYQLIYIDSDAESLSKLKKIIRIYTLQDGLVVNIVGCDNIQEVKEQIKNYGCDIVVLKHGENLPTVEEVTSVIDVTRIDLFCLVDEGKVEGSLGLLDKGVEGILTFSQPNVLHKRIIKSLYAQNLLDEHKNVKQRIKELAERTENLLSTNENAIAYSIDGMLVYANDAFLNYFGFADETDFLGALLLDLAAKDSVSLFKDQISQAMHSSDGVIFENTFKRADTATELDTHYSARKTQYEGEDCLEISIGVEEQLRSIQDAHKRKSSNSKLDFIRSLPEEVGAGSWLVSITVDEYLKIWSYFGIETFEYYMEGAMKHLSDQFRDLKMVRYTDGSLLVVLHDCDITSIDRIGNTIANAVRGYHHPLGDNKIIHSESSFTYASLDKGEEGVSDALKKIEVQSKLIPNVISELMNKVPASVPVSIVNENGEIEKRASAAPKKTTAAPAPAVNKAESQLERPHLEVDVTPVGKPQVSSKKVQTVQESAPQPVAHQEQQPQGQPQISKPQSATVQPVQQPQVQASKPSQSVTQQQPATPVSRSQSAAQPQASQQKTVAYQEEESLSLDEDLNLNFDVDFEAMDTIAPVQPVARPKRSIASILQQTGTSTLSKEDIEDVFANINVPLSDLEALGEFSVLGSAFNNNNVKLHFSPLADFSSNEERYLAGYDVLDENGTLVSWNSAYMFEADNEVSRRLDLSLLDNCLQKLQKEGNDNDFIIMNLTGSVVKNAEFSELFFGICKAHQNIVSRISFGVHNDVLLKNPKEAEIFISRVQELGLDFGLYGITAPEDIESSKEYFDTISFLSISANLVSRLSRVTDENTRGTMQAIFDDLKAKDIAIMAEGVDNPSAMAMVWDYAITLATGRMLSDPLEDLDFDFSQMMM